MKSCCAFNNSHVINSRVVSQGDKVRRKRECLTCKSRWTTIETLACNDDEVFVLGACPLCKGKAELEETVTEITIRCIKCRLTLKRTISEGFKTKTKHELIKKWNTREL